MIKDAALRDNPRPPAGTEHPIRDYGGLQHLHDEDQPEVTASAELAAHPRCYGERTMVGEVYL
jgi:hypothetical protein